MQVIERVISLNLRRRTDRWERAVRQYRQLRWSVERFEAIDGQTLRTNALDPTCIRLHYDTTENARWDSHVPSGQLRRLSRGEIGCALSHVAIWRSVAESPARLTLVLEDDVEFREDIDSALPGYLRQLPASWDVAFLGSHGLATQFEQVSSNWIRPRYQFGSFAYLLTPAGAARLLRTLPVRGPIDNFMADQFSSLLALSCEPPLVRHWGAWNERSDIVHSAQG